MTLYLLFLLMATATVFSPGPGVVMTLSNALRDGVRGSFGGILGIAAGALVVAALSATTLGAVVAASALAFTLLQFAGAAYLAYLGIRLWRAPVFRFAEKPPRATNAARRFAQGLSLQLTNPKAIFFFLSALPQFIDPARDYPLQFATLVFTYAALVVLIHSVYAACAQRARRWLTSERGGRLLNRVAGAMFLLFAATLAAANR